MSLLLSTASFHSFALTGAELLSLCQGDEMGYCTGYVRGVVDARRVDHIVCADHVPTEKLIGEIVSALKEKPALRETRAEVAVALVTVQSWECRGARPDKNVWMGFKPVKPK